MKSFKFLEIYLFFSILTTIGLSCPSFFFTENGVSAYCFKNWDFDGALYLHLESSGLPGHSYSAPEAIAQNWTFDIPVEPEPDLEKAYQDPFNPATLGAGPIGVALNGVPFFGPFGDSGTNVIAPPAIYTQESMEVNGEIVYSEATVLDACAGAEVGGAYRYYVAPPCLVDKTEETAYTAWSAADAFSEPNLLIGYALDGFPIYGPHNSTSKNLDNCNGKFVDGQYAYYATSRFPFLIGCFGPGVYDFDVSILQEAIGQDFEVCAPGTYTSTTHSGCVQCPAGSYDMGQGARAPCSEVCPVGYYCPAGTTYPNFIKCPAGTFGASAGLKDAACSGLCAPGYYCPEGSTSSTAIPCGGPEYYCPEGSLDKIPVREGFYTVPESATMARQAQTPCEPGYYCVEGLKYPCPAGTYGDSLRLNTPGCTALCPLGHYCPLASIIPLECPAGTYGGEEGLKDENCSGLCDLGHYCPSASVSRHQMECPSGSYGSDYGLGSYHCNASCSAADFPDVTCMKTICEPGYYCPSGSNSSQQIECGGAHVYCPAGSSIPTPVTTGYYTIGDLSTNGSDQSGDDRATRWAQELCEPGFYCVDGVRKRCAPGKYGSSYGLADPDCSGDCQAGYYCPIASISLKQIRCNSVKYYCPKGSFNQTEVSEGYFTIGGQADTRVSQEVCPLGHYCMEGVKRPCPPGVYGGQIGLDTMLCSGNCSAGFFCEEGSISQIQVPCPGGTWGVEGMGSNVCSGRCHAGYYCPVNSTSPTQVKCGSDSVYCPEGSEYPLNVSTGYYSTGGDYLTRSGQQSCKGITPPAGTHRENVCPDNLVPEELT